MDSGGAIQNNLNTLPPHLKPFKTPSSNTGPSSSTSAASATPHPKSKMVKLRPPQATVPKPSSKSSTIGSRLASLFDVPPPPLQSPYGALPPHPKTQGQGRPPRLSMESASSPRLSRRSSNASSTTGRQQQPEVLLELHTRVSRETIKPNGLSFGKVEAKKLD